MPWTENVPSLPLVSKWAATILFFVLGARFLWEGKYEPGIQLITFALYCGGVTGSLHSLSMKTDTLGAKTDTLGEKTDTLGADMADIKASPNIPGTPLGQKVE